MTDNFKKNCDDIKKLIQSINTDINKRIDLSKKEKPIVLKDNEIRTSLENLDSLFQDFRTTVNQMQKDFSKYSITEKEAQRRQNICSDFLNQKSELRMKFEETTKSYSATKKLEIGFGGAENFKEKYDKEGVSNQQLYQKQKDERQKQDEQLGIVIDVVQNIKHVAKGMSQEVDEQNELIEEMDYGLDKNIKGMEKTRGKMTKLMEETSNCCFITTIILEIALLICLLIFV